MNKASIGAVFGLSAFYLMCSFITADWFWPSLMYNGVGTDQAERFTAFIIGICAIGVGAAAGEAHA